MSYPAPPSSGPPTWPPAPPSPPRRNIGLVLGGIALALALIAAAGVLTWLLVKDPTDSSASRSAGSATATPTASPSPTASSSPSHSAPPSSPPPTSSAPLDDSDRLRASEFPGDWDFRFGDVALSASYVSSHDYRTCDEVAGERLLDQGCQYAVRWTYKARGGHLMLTVLMYAMGSGADAKAAASSFRSSDVHLPSEGLLPSYAHSKTYASGSADFLVLTVVTTTPGVPDDVATKYLRYANTDFGSALLFR